MTLTIFRINTYEKSRGGAILNRDTRRTGKGAIPATITRSSTSLPHLTKVSEAARFDATWQNLNGLGRKPAKNCGSGLWHAPLRLLLGQGVNHITGSRSVFRHESFFMI